MSLSGALRAIAVLILLGAAVIGFAAAPASAATGPGLCAVLPALCPPTTKAPTKPPVTTAPPTTASKAAARPTTTRPATTTTIVVHGASSLGSGQLPAGAAGGAGLGDAAPQLAPDMGPQLAGSPAPATTVATLPGHAFSGLVGASGGLPSDHSRAREALSIVVVLIAVLAAAQLPASRRSLRWPDR